jgi:hypothetical protein
VPAANGDRQREGGEQREQQQAIVRRIPVRHLDRADDEGHAGEDQIEPLRPSKRRSDAWQGELPFGR